MPTPEWVQTPQQIARHEAGLSLRQLAKATGIHHPLLSQWERGRYNLTIEEVQRISIAIEDAKAAKAA